MFPVLNRPQYKLSDQEEHIVGSDYFKRHAIRSRKRSALLPVTLLATLVIWLLYTHPALLSQQQPKEIPNIVHFVRQLNRNSDGTPQPLSIEFRHFMAYYSAHHYLQPKEINIWSDTTEDMIHQAKVYGDVYTKAVLQIPNLRFRYVEMPNVTSTGVPIEKYAHKSDFVRTRVMAKYGGQYLDDDSWVIRDMKPLRKAGFENVFGKEWINDICQAAWLSTPGNDLMKAFATLQETEFTGDWVKAGNLLISNLVSDIRGYGHDKWALVLERDALFPGQWNIEDDGLPMFYKVHQEASEEERNLAVDNPPVSTIDELIQKYSFRRDFEWRKDWRYTYVIHGFSNAIRDLDAWWMFEPYGGFTPKYVLSRTSNIGRALYPALKAALDSGLLVLDRSLL